MAPAMAAPFDDPLVGVAFGHVIGLSSVRDKPQQPVPPGPAPAESWAYANGAAMAVRRRAVLEVGGFDERLGPGAPVHGEEHDLILRLQEAGWLVRVTAAPPVDHLEWRDDEETRENLLVYSRGAGAFIGAALRRAPRRWARTALPTRAASRRACGATPTPRAWPSGRSPAGRSCAGSHAWPRAATEAVPVSADLQLSVVVPTFQRPDPPGVWSRRSRSRTSTGGSGRCSSSTMRPATSRQGPRCESRTGRRCRSAWSTGP